MNEFEKALSEMIDLVVICGDLLGLDIKKGFPNLYKVFKDKKPKKEKKDEI